MMDLSALSKKFCMRCHREYFSDSEVQWKNMNYNRFDGRWNRGIIYCPVEYVCDGDGGERPTIKCPYRLEHVLATQRKPVVVSEESI